MLRFSFFRKSFHNDNNGTKNNTDSNEQKITTPAIVVKYAEHIPVITLDTEFADPKEIMLDVEKKGDVWMVKKSGHEGIPSGSQVYSVNGLPIPQNATTETILNDQQFPLRLQFILPPCKRDILNKKSRSGFENWKERLFEVNNGVLYYYQPPRDVAETPKLKGSLSLYQCKLGYTQYSNRPFCIALSKSSTDTLVIEFQTETDRLAWASTLYFAIQMTSCGVTPKHANHLQIYRPVDKVPKMVSNYPELRGDFKQSISF